MKFNFLSRLRSRRTVAISFGEDRVAAALFRSTSPTGLVLERLAVHPASEDPDSAAEVIHPLVSALADRTGRPPRGLDCHVSLSPGATILKFVRAPATGGSLDAIAELEASRHVPCALETVSWGYLPLPSDPGEVELAIAAAHRHQVQAIADALLSRGLVPRRMEPGWFSLLRVCTRIGLVPGEAAVVAAVGCRNTEVLFTRGDQLYARTLPVGDELLQPESGLPRSAALAEGLAAELERIGPEAGRFRELPGVLYLQVNGNWSGELALLLADRLRLRVVVLEPLRGVEIAPAVNAADIASAGALIAPLSGLGSVHANPPRLELNLAPPETAHLRTRRTARTMVAAAACALFAPLPLLLASHIAATRSNAAAHRAERDAIPLQSLVLELRREESERAALLRRLAAHQSVEEGRGAWLGILEQLRLALPPGALIEQMVLEGGPAPSGRARFRVKGRAAAGSAESGRPEAGWFSGRPGIESVEGFRWTAGAAGEPRFECTLLIAVAGFGT